MAAVCTTTSTAAKAAVAATQFDFSRWYCTNGSGESLVALLIWIIRNQRLCQHWFRLGRVHKGNEGLQDSGHGGVYTAYL